MILSKSLKHDWYYYYKIHQEKLQKARDHGHDPVAEFLLQARDKEQRPDNRFAEGPRSSQVRLNDQIQPSQTDHLVTHLASIGLDSDFYKDDHMNVQMFMLAYDKETVAMEIPVWFNDPPQLDIDNAANLTGHIDLLRVENGELWIWDFKPDAHLEEHATTQTWLYALMLSQRTGTPLTDIHCGFFDDKQAYTFRPTHPLKG